jgi:hypothetical protein
MFFQVAFPAVLHNNVDTTFGLEHFVELDDVRVTESIHDLNFGVEGLLLVCIFFEQLEIDLFDCNFCFGCVFKSLVDLSEGPVSET